ncbi:MAG: hypothetical protein ACTJLL_03125 [Anaplasma sp.]
MSPINGKLSHQDFVSQDHTSDAQESDSGIEGGSTTASIEPCTAPKNPVPTLESPATPAMKMEGHVSTSDESDSDSLESQHRESIEENHNTATAATTAPEPTIESPAISPPLQNIIAADAADAKMSSTDVDEVFKHPYKLAALVSQKICKYSKVDISKQGMYSLFCDVLLEELMGQGYVPGELQPQQTINKETVSKCAHFQGGSKASSITNKVSVLNLNRHIADAVSLEDYITSLETLETTHSVSRALQGLLHMRDKTPLPSPMDESRVPLRAVYSCLVFLESHGSSIDDYEEEGSGQLVLHFVDEMLPSIDIHEALNGRNHQNFRQCLHNAAMKDARELSSVLTTLVPRALTYLGAQCNTLLSSMITYQYLSANQASPTECEEMKARVGKSALLCIESVLLFSSELCREADRLYLNPNNLLEAIRRDNAARILKSENFAKKLISEVVRPLKTERGLLAPQKHLELGNLERAAAAMLLFYPGCDVRGTDFVLSTGGAQLLNVGEEKIAVANNKFFDKDSTLGDAHKEELLLKDIQNIFQNFRLSVGSLSWSKFLEELDDLCDTIVTKGFADKARPNILQKLLDVEHVHDPNVDIGTIVYESFLPRVKYIREFLRNKELMDAAEHFVNFLHSRDDAASNTLSGMFMKVCGYSQEANPASEQQPTPPEPETHELQTGHEGDKQALFYLIDTYKEAFVQRFEHQDNIIVDTELFEGRAERVSAAQYQVAELDTAQRHDIVKTLARRSSRHLFYYLLPYTSVFSALVLSCIVIGVSAAIFMLPILVIVVLVTLCWAPTLALVFSDSASWSVSYLMSVTPDSMKEAAKILYPQYQCIARTVEGTTQSVTPSAPTQNEVRQEDQDQPGDHQRPGSAATTSAAAFTTDPASPTPEAVQSMVLNPGISSAAAFTAPRAAL